MLREPDVLPEWQIATWLNVEAPLEWRELRGQVVLVHAFQMLCPSCVAHGIPQALAVERTFRGEGVRVIGLHTVFEHHEAMTEVALRAFLHEYRIGFPVAIDRPGSEGDRLPCTMAAWGLRGTPSLILLDARGALRLHHFGRIEDLALGAVIGQLLTEARAT